MYKFAAARETGTVELPVFSLKFKRIGREVRLKNNLIDRKK